MEVQMKLPDDVQYFLDKLHFVNCGENEQEVYRAGFNAGFASFRDSEMMRDLIESIKTTQVFFDYEDKKEAIHNLQEIFKVLDKYKKWLNQGEEK
jgi:hypothetical protein